MPDEESVFTREAALTPEFVPSGLPGREAHLRELAALLEPALRGLRPRNAFLHGPPGSGKTASARYVLRQLEAEGPRVLSLYVNAWQESTRLAVLSRLAVLLRLPLPRRGLAEDEVLTRVMEELRNEKKVLVVVLDEVDRLEGRDRVLYDLSRAGEIYGVPVGVLAVSNHADVLASLDTRVRSSLTPRSLEFNAYSPPELKAILRERARLAFRPGAIREEAVAVTAALASKNNGDARFAIELLLSAGRYADRKGLGHVGVSEVKAAQATFEARPLQKLPQALGRGEELLLRVLRSLPAAGKEGVPVGLAYGEYSKQKPESDRGLRSHLALLEKRGLVETWMDNNQRFVKLREES